MDWCEAVLNAEDINPKKRMAILIDRAKKTQIDSNVHVKRYYDIAVGLLKSAKKLRKTGKYEEALLSFLRYQNLVKKLKKHTRFMDIPMGQRAAFEYKLQEVFRIVKELTEIVLMEYERFKNLTELNPHIQDIDGFQEQRPTLSTVRTFVSTSRQSLTYPHSLQKFDATLRMRKKGFSEPRISSAVSISMLKYLTPSTTTMDATFGIRKSVFATRQVKEFEEIYKQRRIVRKHRTLIVPSKVTTVFSYVSLDNNKHNVETVGYLAGKEINSELVVTHLILPEQLGFSDYFKVVDSVRLPRYLDREDLMTFGWIHSHPVETTYLSSSDMHYHSVFQNVLPEAVAMVYSPKEMKSTIFNLTPNHGLDYISNCTKKGFHAHPTKPALVMVSQHAILDLFGELTVKDFRVGSKQRFTFDMSGSGAQDFGFTDMFERMLKVSTSSHQVSGGKIRRSEVSFRHLKKS